MPVTINNFSAQIEVGQAQTSGKLTLYPLFTAAAKEGGGPPLSYLLLADALDSGTFQIGEISESGSVNTVLITNMTGQPVLFLDGEEILGAKQNRMVNATILVAAGKQTAIPVSCVERGRWHYASETFGKSETFAYSTLRRQKAEQVHFSLKENSSFSADQGAIWAEIDRSQDCLGVNSPTAALHETYNDHDQKLSEMIEAFKTLPGQTGLIVYINNRFVCLDLFDQPATLEKLMPRLLKSYAVEALNSSGRPATQLRPTPDVLLKAIDKSEYLTYPSVGLGQDIRLNGPGIVGAGLLVEEQIVHLSVFAEEQRENEGHINTPGRRRRNLG
ncbi:MAG: DUF6569 family protein [Dethiobacteria bacterium]|nr:DUF6569 family protein [Dethiobacteria bacterium]